MKSKSLFTLVAAGMLAFSGTTYATEITKPGYTINTLMSQNSESVLNWQQNTHYFVGDQVIYQGKVYECTVEHSRLTPTTKYVWRLVEGVIPAWQKNTKYFVGDKVTYQGKIYECIVDHSRLKPTTKYVWRLVGSVIPAWQKNTHYCTGDQVTYEGKTYECTVDHSRLTPTTKYVWKIIA